MLSSTRNRASKRQSRPAAAAFRITKSSKLNLQTPASKQKLAALEEVVQPKVQPQPEITKKDSTSKKRRRDLVDSDVENKEVATRPQKSVKKARPTIPIPTPPASSPEPESLPEALEELKALHKSFVQALTVHFAHNGTRNAVQLSVLMPAMTRLWKRRTVTLVDVQRMLSLWESSIHQSKEVEHHDGPFKLVMTGIGSGQQTKVEYAWTEISGSFREDELHREYETAVEKLYGDAKKDEQSYSFVFEPLVYFPSLKCQIGSQTQARQEKISSIRDQILSRPLKQSLPSISATQTETDFSKLNLSDPADHQAASSSREDKLKSRTLGLFDRLRAKQLVNSTSTSPTSSVDLLRRRALHRIPDIIDVLRLKQSQKLNTLFRSDLHGLPSGTRAMKTKVSFSLEQLVQEIRDSGRVPIAPEEIKVCISILGSEMPDPWCSFYNNETVKCVTLQGEGWKKEDVKEWCEQKITSMGSK